VLARLSAVRIAGRLGDPASSAARAVGGGASTIIAAVKPTVAA
jgi:hypothetical protein